MTQVGRDGILGHVSSPSPNPVLEEQKRSLRLKVRAKVQSLDAARKITASKSLCDLLLRQTVLREARSVLFFSPLKDEPDVWPLVITVLAEGRQVALPRFDPVRESYVATEIRDAGRDIVVGKFGIREPASGRPAVELNRLDLVLVPGVAFDARGGRLGRGKGYYDRLLASVCGMKCGVAFDEQMVDAVPAGPQDIRLNCILTPTRWIET